jgi:uncharacterized protein
MADFHAFEKGGEDFLFFPRSARLFQLSPEAACVLSGLSDPGAPGISGVPAASLQHQDDVEPLRSELHDLVQREMQVPLPPKYSSNKSVGQNSYQTFSLYLAQDCNMSCCYCWNRGGSFGKTPRLMNKKNAQRVTRLIVSLIESSTAAKIFINFYGGEPLLNFPALKSITLDLLKEEERLGKKFFFTVDTNGFLMKGKTAQFLARHFAQIGVSLDGRQEIHDTQRPAKSGEATWQQIVDNVTSFPEPRLLGLRATLTSYSDSYLDTFRQLTSLGVSRIQLEYCHEPNCHQDTSYKELLVPLERQLEELTEFVDDYIETISRYSRTRDIPYVSTILDNIARVRRGSRYTKPCGAGMNTLAIDCQGEVFPCIAFVDHDEFVMGRINASGTLTLNKSLKGFEVDSITPCDTCWLRYDCAGGCYATNFDLTGHPQSPDPRYCHNMKSRAEIYVYALAQMLKKCPWHLEDAPDSPTNPLQGCASPKK